MTDLAAINVVVSFPSSRCRQAIAPGMKVSIVDLTFGNSALQYGHTNGIPLPAVADFDVREALFVDIEQPGNGYVYRYDRTNHRLKIYQGSGGTLEGNTGATSGGTPAGTNSAPAFTGTPASPGTPAGTVAPTTPAGTVDPGTHVFSGAESAAPAFSGTALANFTPAGAVAAPAFTGAQLGTHVHALSAGDLAAGPLGEVPHDHAPAPTVLRLMVFGI